MTTEYTKDISGMMIEFEKELSRVLKQYVAMANGYGKFVIKQEAKLDKDDVKFDKKQLKEDERLENMVDTVDAQGENFEQQEDMEEDRLANIEESTDPTLGKKGLNQVMEEKEAAMERFAETYAREQEALAEDMQHQ